MICGQNFHGFCDLPIKCINCGDDHKPQDKRCEKFQINIEIKKLMTNSSLNVSEAKERRAGIVDLMKVLVFIGIFYVYLQIIAQIRIGHMH